MLSGSGGRLSCTRRALRGAIDWAAITDWLRIGLLVSFDGSVFLAGVVASRQLSGAGVATRAEILHGNCSGGAV